MMNNITQAIKYNYVVPHMSNTVYVFNYYNGTYNKLKSNDSMFSCLRDQSSGWRAEKDDVWLSELVRYISGQ